MTQMTRQEPFAESTGLREAMDRLFDSAFVRPTAGLVNPGMGLPMNLYEQDDQTIVEACLPGISQEDIQATVDDNVLTITATRRSGGESEESQQQGRWHAREFGPAAFRRTVRLPYPVEVDRCQATFVHGVLTLTLPRLEATKPKRIQIGTGARQVTAGTEQPATEGAAQHEHAEAAGRQSARWTT